MLFLSASLHKLQETISNPETVVIYYYLTDCPSCKAMSPIYQNVASSWEQSNQRIQFATFNVVDSEAKNQANLERFPTIVTYHSGQEIDRTIGLQKQDVFEEWLKHAISAGGGGRILAQGAKSKDGDPLESHAFSSTTAGENRVENRDNHNSVKMSSIPDSAQIGPSCTGVFEDRKPKRLQMLLGTNNKPFSDPEPECIIRPTPNLKGAQIGRANEGSAYFSICVWHEPGDSPQKIFFGLNFMPDPVAKERFQSARFEVSFAHNDAEGRHPPLKILDIFPTSTADLDVDDRRSISTFSTSSLDLPSENEQPNSTSTTVNGQGIHSPTAVWTFVEDDSQEVKRGLDAHYTVSVTLPSTDRVWFKFYAKAVLLVGERIGPWRKVTLQSGSLEAPYKRILDLSEVE